VKFGKVIREFIKEKYRAKSAAKCQIGYDW